MSGSSTDGTGLRGKGSEQMQSVGLKRRNLLLGGLAVAATGFSLALSPHRRLGLAHGAVIADAIPVEAGQWKSSGQGDFILAPEDEMRAAAIYQTVLTRNYADGKHPDVMLMIAYDETQSSLLHIHTPENCYPAAGFQIIHRSQKMIDVGGKSAIPAKFITARSPLRTEQVLYWSRLGDKFPTSSLQLQLALIVLNLKGFVPDGALIRLSSLTADPAEALNSMISFARDLFVSANQNGRTLLLGPQEASGYVVGHR